MGQALGDDPRCVTTGLSRQPLICFQPPGAVVYIGQPSSQERGTEIGRKLLDAAPVD